MLLDIYQALGTENRVFVVRGPGSVTKDDRAADSHDLRPALSGIKLEERKVL